ncbi:hypothetical protein SNOG_09799 [Parastagonospora nodorum SN15]|uniref:Uncharacterized protein n=1 Tax=Phaeosphaeria nodorum (strain SN15 / ATCC MYA-4574 / FGSC 10173) TaxID=321614 RepID=Q0UEL5_PHANO|nr:hypothetical protein SNOG_09799 [Parastagonospora nodorum SN15]EAT83064.1 hypothetical protein SNOG_09799 [Parastagonospora nodorum SN15]
MASDWLMHGSFQGIHEIPVYMRFVIPMSNARDRKGYAHVGVDGGRGEGSERRHDMNDSGNEVGPRLKVGPLDSGATHGSIATASWHLFSPRDVPVICPPPNLAFISSLDCSSGLRASVAGGASHSRYTCKPSSSTNISRPASSTPSGPSRDHDKEWRKTRQ